jgi:hypothetical protein
MNYRDGRKIRLGDHVRLQNKEVGVVIFSIDTDEYSVEYPKCDWSYLGSGVMVRTSKGALIHLDGTRENELSRA